MKWGILFMFMMVSLSAASQELTVTQLINMLNWSEKQIDTTMKKKGYVLMQKDLDSTSRLFQYTQLDKKEDSTANVHSFTFIDAATERFKSRLITYRTYNNEEFQRIASWLLSHNFRSTNQYEFQGFQNTLYTNGEREIRVKIGNITLKNRKNFTAYEVEIGR